MGFGVFFYLGFASIRAIWQEHGGAGLLSRDGQERAAMGHLAEVCVQAGRWQGERSVLSKKRGNKKAFWVTLGNFSRAGTSDGYAGFGGSVFFQPLPKSSDLEGKNSKRSNWFQHYMG